MPGQESASVADIGVCIAEQVLGADIFLKLWESEAQRTLRIQLPGASDQENLLVAALARVPWEIARPAANKQTLAERNLLVRVVHDRTPSLTPPLELAADECLRVPFVFAEARGSRPLAARKERHELLRPFRQEIGPQRRIVADFLTHGVTRQRLETQIADRGGYHIVHWSGHGHLNLLELAQSGGASDRLSGDELLDLFTQSGGFIPRLFFLSDCHSGDILRVRDWNDFIAIAAGREPDVKQPDSKQPSAESATKDIPLDEQPGYTGTAHALLQRGVPAVVAMRYAVGDDYARELGVEFYRALLAHQQPKTAAAALLLARRTLRERPQTHGTRYTVCDHATPVFYGAEDVALPLPPGRSPGLETRRRRLHQIGELTDRRADGGQAPPLRRADLGTGRSGRGLHRRSSRDQGATGGRHHRTGRHGKTALTAESLDLWESHFEWVLLYQAKPQALGFEATLRDIHLQLNSELGRYHDYVQAHPADAIHRAAASEFTGPARLLRLTQNLVRALQDEKILLVLDNFEATLKPEVCGRVAPQLGPESRSDSATGTCQDPA